MWLAGQSESLRAAWGRRGFCWIVTNFGGRTYVLRHCLKGLTTALMYLTCLRFCVKTDYKSTLMLKRSWNNPTAPPQFNPRCRRLTKDQLETESGLADMPPVEREIAALTSLGPARVTTNPKCPVRECHKTDTLVCRSYNAAARAARSGNALAILLAAI